MEKKCPLSLNIQLHVLYFSMFDSFNHIFTTIFFLKKLLANVVDKSFHAELGF